MDTRRLAESFAEDFRSGNALGAIEAYYADDVEVHRCRIQEVTVRRGKAASGTAAIGFLTNCTVHGVEVESVLSDGDKAVIELSVDATPNGGDRRTSRIVMVQTWRQGKVVRQWNYFA